MITERTVATPSDAQSAMVELAKLPRTLMGGTRAMRKAAQTYLPKEPKETDAAYKIRLDRTTLFNAFGKTVEDMTGKVFDKPIVLEDDVPAELVTFAENVDMTGRHINVFARDVFFDGMQTGIGFILTDMPPAVKRMDGSPGTLADEQKAGIRPYLVYIPLERLLGWKSTMVGGAETLTQIRILECVTEAVDEFHDKEVEQVKVIAPGVWTTYRKVVEGENTGKWVAHETGTYSLNKITLAPFYTKRTDFMKGAPPLEKLADLNVAHWQSQSDQRNILHVARVPILFGAGFGDEAEIEIGASAMTRNSNENAKLTFVEHSGAAIGAGDKDLDNLERQMQAMGLALLVDTPGQSATGEIRDDSKENSPLAMMANSLGDALEQSLGFMAEYIGKGADVGGSVKVNTDFGIQAGAGADVPNIISAEASGLIDKITAINELKRRGFLGEDVDAETVKSRAEAENAAALDAAATAGGGLNGGPPA